MINLRYYQKESVDATFDFLCNSNGNALICHPTGAGKSVVIAELARRAVTDYGGKVIILQHRKELIEQNAAKVRVLLPGVEVGIFSAGLGLYEHKPSIVCAGIQSIYKTPELFAPRNLVICDECHLIPNDGEGMYRTFLSGLEKCQSEGFRVVGLTATPFRTGEGKIYGEGRFFSEMVYNSDIIELIDQGFLCDMKAGEAKASVDTSNLHRRAGEFIAEEVEQLFSNNVTVDAVNEIVNATIDRNSVMIFATSVKHACYIENLLHMHPGVSPDEVGTVFGNTSPLERASTIAAFVDRRIKFLVNVDVLCLDDQTEILCRDGWCSIDEMTSDKLVAAWETDGSIKFDHPKTIVRRPMMEDEVFATLKTNAVDVRVTSNHRMIVSVGADGNKRWAIKQAFEIIGKAVSMPAHGLAEPDVFSLRKKQTGKKARQARIRSLTYIYKKRLSLSQQDARKMAEIETARKESFSSKMPSELSIEECILIGFWIGDGTKSCGRVSLAQSMAYPDNVDLIDRLLEITGIQHSRREYPPASKTVHASIRWTLARGTGSGDQSRNGYYSIEEYLDKDGSDLLWGLNEKQFHAVLYGWWIADGVHHGKYRSGMQVSCVNKKLIDTLQAIATCRGIRTSVRICSKPRSEKHQQQWTMSWCSAKVISVVKNRFVEEKPSKKERVWCVTSSTGNIVTRRNGKVCVVGNTTGFDAPCIDAIAILRATASPGLYAQIVGRGLRVHESKADCIVLDFGENIKRHGSIDRIRAKRIAQAARDQVEAEAKEKQVGVKECPKCEVLNLETVLECECGYVFPVEGRHNSQSESTLAVVGKTPPQVFDVIEVEYSKWSKPDKPDTMRVDYRVSKDGKEVMFGMSEWICFDHTGYARKKAEEWWLSRSCVRLPNTTADAITMATLGATADPTQIVAEHDGKYWTIKHAVVLEKPNEYEEWEEAPF